MSLGAETPINVVRLKMWKFPASSPETASGYTSVMDLQKDDDNRLMSYQDTPNIATAQLYGCGELACQVTKNLGGALVYNVHALSNTERNAIFGETASSDPPTDSILKGNEVPPYFICAHAEELPNGHWNLYKYYKVQFTPGQIGTQQVEGNNVNFATTTLNGIYSKNNTTGINMMRKILYDVDPTDTSGGATFVSNWFSSAF